MTARRPLARQIALLGALNLILIAGILLVFVSVQFGGRPSDWIIGPARDHLLGIAQKFSLELGHFEPVAVVLERFGKEHKAQFFLIGPRGESLSGEPVALPEVVERRLRPKGPPPPKDGRRPPPPRDPVFFVSAPDGYWVGVRMPMADQRPAILLMRSDSIWNAGLFFNYPAWLGLIVAVVGGSLLCWLPFVRSLTQTIRQLGVATEQIATGNFKVAVPTGRPDELGLLGMRIQQMAARLGELVSGQKRFLGDIAHELSAPIARVQFSVGILEQHADDKQLQRLEALREELEEMATLTGELLSFSKAGFQAMETPLAAVQVAPLVERVVTKEGVERVVVIVAPEFAVLASEAMLERSIANLVRNAKRYAGEAGPITIQALEEGRKAVIAVADCGPGLPEDELERVFAPFYRPEEARTRETGGAGLGLAIVKSCVEACRGEIECRNVKPHGLEVRIRLSLA